MVWARGPDGRLVRGNDRGGSGPEPRPLKKQKSSATRPLKKQKSGATRHDDGGGSSSSSSSTAPPPLPPPPTGLHLAALGAYNISRLAAFLPNREMAWLATILRAACFGGLDSSRAMDLRSLTLASTREHTIRALRCARFFTQGPLTARGAASHGLRRAPQVRAISLDVGREGELALLPGILSGFDPAVLKVLRP